MVGKQVALKVETVAVADLKEHPRNYRKHPDDQIEHLVESIREHGFYRNIVVARGNVILAGHGLALAAQKMGIERLPVVRLDLDPLEPRALKVLAGDNEVAHLGMVDDRALTEILKEIKEADPEGLLGTGYDEMMLANLVFVTRPQSEVADFNAAAEWVGMPEYAPGIPVLRLSVQFKTEEDRRDFLAKVGIEEGDVSKFSGGTSWSTWWPPRRTTDLISAQFVERGE